MTIDQAIATLQSGAGQDAVSSALNLLSQAQQQSQFESAQTLARDQAAKKSDLLTVGEGQTIYDPNTGKALYTAPKTYKPEEGYTSNDLSILSSIFGKTQTPTSTQTPQSNAPQMSAPANKYFQQPDGSIWKSTVSMLGITGKTARGPRYPSIWSTYILTFSYAI